MRGVEWGVFQVAPIVAGGIMTGYGATCGRHTDPGDIPHVKCKIQLSFGKDGRFSEQEARQRVKRWCLLGFDADMEDHVDRRTHHLSMKPRRLVLDMTEADMDNLAGALL